MNKDNPNIRALKFMRSLYPKYFDMSIFNRIVEAILPYFGIYMSAEIVNELVGGRNPKRVLALVLITLVGNLVIDVFKNISEHLCNIYQRTWYDAEAACFNDKTLSLDYSDLEEPEVRQLRRKITESAWIDNHGIQHLRYSFFNLFSAAADIVIAFIFSLGMVISILTSGLKPVPVICLIIFIAAAVGQTLYSRMSMAKLSKLWNKAAEDMMDDNRISAEMQTYNMGKDIRIYNLKGFYRRVVEKMTDDLFNSYTTMTSKQFRLGVPESGISFLRDCTLYLAVALSAVAGAFGAGDIVKYVSAISRLSTSIGQLFYHINEIKANTPFIEDYLRYLDIPRKMYQGSLPIEKRAFCEGGDYNYKIEFKDVSFKYPGSDDYALRHLSITFNIGERLAVVGRNGSGKTTFIKLLCRLYDPTEGRILLNGVDISKYDYDEYMRVFTVVFQDFRLFGFKLSENVAAGLDINEDFCRSCLEKVGFGDKLEELPEGLETYLYKNFDKNGIEISGGEAQKIALARALYKNAPFIILDEPTAALDPIAEAAIYEQFNGIVGDKTAVYISHRLSSCRFCDRIAVFDAGSIVQIGTHDSLSEEDGLYKELWEAQAAYYVKQRNRITEADIS